MEIIMCRINGKKLREIRESKGMTLRDVSERVGVSFSAISRYERNEDVPKDEIVDRLCLVLKINKKEIKVADVGYSFTSGESKIVSETRKKKGFIRYSTPKDTEKFIQEHATVSEMTELKEVSNAIKNSFGIAKKRYILIDPTMIHIPDWQRNTDMAAVQEIAQNFNEDKFDPIKVYIKNGKLVVADGAHRIVAFVINRETKILVEILNCNEHEAILTFLGQQSMTITQDGD